MVWAAVGARGGTVVVWGARVGAFTCVPCQKRRWTHPVPCAGTEELCACMDALPVPTAVAGKMPGVEYVKLPGCCGCPHCAAVGRSWGLSPEEDARFQPDPGSDPPQPTQEPRRIHALNNRSARGSLCWEMAQSQVSWFFSITSPVMACGLSGVGTSGAASKGARREPNPPERSITIPARSSLLGQG